MKLNSSEKFPWKKKRLHMDFYKIFRIPIWLTFKVRRILLWIGSFQFASAGKGLYIGKDKVIIGPQYIHIGSNFWAGDRFRIEAHGHYRKDNYSPCIRIGDNVIINYDCHIGAINLIEIGDNVLIASRVFISDHTHGDTELDNLKPAPRLRPLVSKGPIVIEENVLIGEGVSILPNVRIGRNSVVGANAVVTRDIPAYSVAVGVPAKVIKTVG